MYYSVKIKRAFVAVVFLAALVISGVVWMIFGPQPAASVESRDFIRWVDFDVPEELLSLAMEADIASRDKDTAIDWVELLAYLGAKYGGDFSQYRRGDFDKLLMEAEEGASIAKLGESLGMYDYYYEAYSAVLGGFIGEYQVEGDEGWESRYGLKAYSPIAQTFPYSDYDDFGASRSYGYRRRHLGHDMMAAVGTPVIAVESGVVEAMGWNQYGGWRIGIRSFDGLRYHYYAHLRKDRPYAENLEIGQTVMAGDVIGYVGRTGYSATENTNNIDTSHLHYGLQLIFDESQKEGETEIWIDVYDLCCLLRNHQSQVQRNDETKEWTRTRGYREELPVEHGEAVVESSQPLILHWPNLRQ